MPPASLITYVNALKAKGKPDAEIKHILQQAGWDPATIDAAFHGIPEPPLPRPGQTVAHLGMWEGFEHVLMFFSLYALATSLGLLMHQFVNIWSPPAQTDSMALVEQAISGYVIRGAVATLAVAYPLFAYFYLDIVKRTRKNPDIRQLRSRKTFIYLTLVVTFLIAVGNIIQTILSLLNGNVSVNFLLHLAVTMGITLMIFVHYLLQVIEDRRAL